MTDNISIAEIRRMFRQYGHPVDLRIAEKVSLALGPASIATGWSRKDCLEVTAINARDGAIDRLLVLLNEEIDETA